MVGNLHCLRCYYCEWGDCRMEYSSKECGARHLKYHVHVMHCMPRAKAIMRVNI